jgi:hypothetical protein
VIGIGMTEADARGVAAAALPLGTADGRAGDEPLELQATIAMERTTPSAAARRWEVMARKPRTGR